MCDELELEPGEAERLAATLALGLILADLVAHPVGAAALLADLKRGAGDAQPISRPGAYGS
jgi:hypothetical protein